MEKDLKFKVVTDSTADIPEEISKALGIEVIPYYIHLEGRSFKESIEITPEEVWSYLEKTEDLSKLPKTACPGVGEYYETFKKILEEGKRVLSIHMTSWGSGAFQSANTAKQIIKEEEPEAEIEVLDSKSVSLGTGFMVIEAAKASLKGWDLKKTIEHINEVRSNLFHAFTNDTLKFLAAGGRIGKAKYLLAEMLKINPIISVDHDGVLVALDKAIGRVKAYQKIVSHMNNFFKDKKFLNIGFLHASAEEEVKKLKEEISKVFEIKNIIVNKLSAALSVHAGPGTVGVIAYPSNLSIDIETK
ncbi:DegV family protein [Dictyoglomus thermophilum]|uniref:DegV family protein n=1 Tax=Dictyoglomus thermophilum (strain ATCC 35947 / DSM 3960 / H-6-12) TaxID=309799 RepID=B5YDF8_DICT6|nr:DegV family protein [Dictyoglomus thermophilum]ACI18364.1 DegV family protein [Dictyoglomus thermophilum H-6-12]